MRQVSKKRAKLLPTRAKVCAAVRQRDSNRCQAVDRLYGATLPVAAVAALPKACGGPLDCHEIIPKSAWAGGWLVESNVILVCRSHHDFIGNWPEAAALAGLHAFSWSPRPLE